MLEFIHILIPFRIERNLRFTFGTKIQLIEASRKVSVASLVFFKSIKMQIY